MRILGIETSCDETAASVLKGREILANCVSSQYLHSRYGGVIPEVASRAHIKHIIPIIQTALEIASLRFSDIDLIAVTYGPGLIGSLLVGLSFAKGLALSLGKPFIGVNHIEGHIFSTLLSYPDLSPPFLSLIISGGHTELYLVEEICQYRLLGMTLDDACGEAFDKVGKILGLPYPSGFKIETLARKGKRTVPFPVPRVSGANFSFSGLKTAVLYFRRENERYPVEDIAHSFQETVFDFLEEKILFVVRNFSLRKVSVSGGVAANQRLRERLDILGKKEGIRFYIPPLYLCTDNAAMIAFCGYERFKRFGPSKMDLEAKANEILAE
uniref:tRNA N6-adenosine threonylcarbamoyltransferase n=1 Tax=candidate division WOR-3 bacterium TaxID=2052148 RepID=A0A7C3YV15_UNCW3